MSKVLPISAFLFLLLGAAAGQHPVPASTQQRFATTARLEALTLNDLPKLLSEAQSGDPTVEYLLALVYEEGRLLPKDLAAAQNWMLKSAEQGYVPAQEGMGEMYLINVRHDGPIPGRDEAERWLRLAAMQGNADAQERLGNGYERGWFGAADYAEALKWLREAAAQGLPWAQFGLAEMYEAGEGVPASDTIAADWYRKAADHFSDAGGVWEAEGQLAYMYSDGRLPKDDVQAYMWFAIVGSSLDPPVDDDIKRIARHMTKAQIVQAQSMAEDWIKRHTRPANLATSPTPH